MAIYVDAKLAEMNIDDADFSWCTDIDNIIEACIEALQRTPQADVAPVIHAHWKWMRNYDVICSKCQYVLPSGSPVSYFRFCPHCGAKMNEEVE